MSDADTIVRLTAKLERAREENRQLREQLNDWTECEVCHTRGATKLCDRILGLVAPEAWAEPFTCDLPMCDDCAHVEGHVHWHGGSEGGRQAPSGGSDTQDVCPKHVDARDALEVITEREADQRRAAARILPVP